MGYTTEVVVCTFNGREFLEEQLASILAQSQPVDKISIYDDQSSDGTVSFIHDLISSRFRDSAQLFKVEVNPTNLGYAKNFCNGITRASNDIIFLCDQDDVWAPEKVESFMRVFEDSGPDMVFSDGDLIDASGKLLGPTSVLESYGLAEAEIASFASEAFELLLKRNYVNGAAAAVRRAAAQAAMPLPCPMPHDQWLALWCALHGGVVGIPRRLYRYRQHARNIIGVGKSNWLYTWGGVWRHPRGPRQRDLEIWRAVTDRISQLSGPQANITSNVRAARSKLHWLESVVASERSGLSRCYNVGVSVLTGKYRRYATGIALLRDIVGALTPAHRPMNSSDEP